MLGGAFVAALGLLAPTLGEEATEPVSIRHHVRQHESLARIAADYGVTEQQLRAWNGLSGAIGPGMTLHVQPRTFPRPRQKRRIEVGEDDTWEAIASRYAVTVDEVQLWNGRLGKRKQPPRRATLVLWLPSGVERWPLRPLSDPLPEIAVRAGGTSIGRPNRGRLRNGVALPVSDDYTVRVPYQAYGTSMTVRDVQRAIAGFRHETGFDDRITIGAMSRRTGRRLRPHKSHQSGRDVDVRLPAMPFVEGHSLESHEVDWHATYALIEAFVRTGDVKVIYLERRFYGRLRQAAARLGADDERIAFVLGHLRHEKGHTGHIHVRFLCDPAELECRD